MPGTANRTHAWYAKHLFYLGVALLVGGVLSELAGPIVFTHVPGWWETMGVDMEILGILTGFVAVFGFGILLPLIE